MLRSSTRFRKKLEVKDLHAIAFNGSFDNIWSVFSGDPRSVVVERAKFTF